MPRNDNRPDLNRAATSFSGSSEDSAAAPAVAGSSPEVVPPRTYHIQHDGWHKGVRIWGSEPLPECLESSKEPSLDSDGRDDLFDDAESQLALIKTTPHGLRGTPKNQEEEKKKKYNVIDPSRIPASYYIKRLKFAKYVMFEGSGPDDECSWAKRLITIDGEGILSRNSKYTQVDGDCMARMYGQDGPDPILSWRNL